MIDKQDDDEDCLYPFIRQYRRQRSDAYVLAYDIEGVDRVFARLCAQKRYGMWISVKAGLPPLHQTVIVALSNGSVIPDASYTPNLGWGYNSVPEADDFGETITHWMPLPTAPKGTA